jgi:hypothetical protein
MNAKDLGRHGFGKRIHEVLFPSAPIRSIEFLFGRDDQLTRISKALMAPGRQIFIYGERGVGKSSLAEVAANEYQSSDADLIQVSCSSDATFQSVVWELIQKTNTELRTTVRVKAEANVKAPFLGGSVQHETIASAAMPPLITEEAASRLDKAFADYSAQTIAVIDEFDRIPDAKERGRFAELLKALGDKNSQAKLIFTGVASSLDELLESHGSAHRQLDTIHLDRLSYQPRIDIVQRAMEAFEISADESVVYRIANVSNGFPYYVHLMTEHLLWAWYEDGDADSIEMPHLHKAFGDACNAVDAELRRPYEQAPRGRDQAGYVLWAVADAYDLERTGDAIWRSYQQICEALPLEALERKKVAEQLRKLRDPSCGKIMSVDSVHKLHRYTEPMVRGYVRMVAARHNVHLDDQTFDAPPQIMHIPNMSRRKIWVNTDRFLPPVEMDKGER